MSVTFFSTGFGGRRMSSSRSSASSAALARTRLLFLGFDHVDGQLHEIADHRFHIPPDIAHLGEFRRLDLDEGRVVEFGKPPGDFGLADAGGPDHDDVLRGDLLPQLLRDILAAPAVPERDRHGPLGLLLADDVLIQFFDDLPRCQIIR